MLCHDEKVSFSSSGCSPNGVTILVVVLLGPILDRPGAATKTPLLLFILRRVVCERSEWRETVALRSRVFKGCGSDCLFVCSFGPPYTETLFEAKKPISSWRRRNLGPNQLMSGGPTPQFPQFVWKNYYSLGQGGRNVQSKAVHYFIPEAYRPFFVRRPKLGTLSSLCVPRYRTVKTTHKYIGKIPTGIHSTFSMSYFLY